MRYFLLIKRLKYIDRVRKYDILFSDYLNSNFEMMFSGVFAFMDVQYGDGEKCFWIPEYPLLFFQSTIYNFALSSIALFYIFCSSKHTSTFNHPILLSFLALFGGLYRFLGEIYKLLVELFTKATFLRIFYVIIASSLLFGVGYYTYLIAPLMFAYGDTFFIVHYYIFYVLLLLQIVLFHEGINY